METLRSRSKVSPSLVMYAAAAMLTAAAAVKAKSMRPVLKMRSSIQPNDSRSSSQSNFRVAAALHRRDQFLPWDKRDEGIDRFKMRINTAYIRPTNPKLKKIVSAITIPPFSFAPSEAANIARRIKPTTRTRRFSATFEQRHSETTTHRRRK